MDYHCLLVPSVGALETKFADWGQQTFVEHLEDGSVEGGFAPR